MEIKIKSERIFFFSAVDRNQTDLIIQNNICSIKRSHWKWYFHYTVQQLEITLPLPWKLSNDGIKLKEIGPEFGMGFLYIWTDSSHKYVGYPTAQPVYIFKHHHVREHH